MFRFDENEHYRQKYLKYKRRYQQKAGAAPPDPLGFINLPGHNTYATWSKGILKKKETDPPSCFDREASMSHISDHLEGITPENISDIDIGGSVQGKYKKGNMTVTPKSHAVFFTGGTGEQRLAAIKNNIYDSWQDTGLYAVVPVAESYYTALSIWDVFEHQLEDSVALRASGKPSNLCLVAIGSTDGHVSNGTIEGSKFLGGVAKKDTSNAIVDYLTNIPDDTTSIWLAGSFTYLFLDPGMRIDKEHSNNVTAAAIKHGLWDERLTGSNCCKTFDKNRLLELLKLIYFGPGGWEGGFYQYVYSSEHMQEGARKPGGKDGINIKILISILENKSSIKTVYVGSRT